MKIILSLFLSFISFPIFASDPSLSLPNWVECSNEEQKIQLIYSTLFPGTKGRAFNYAKGVGRQINTNEITEIETALGSVLTVQDPQLSMPDRQTATVSLILPDINIIKYRTNGLPIPFETMVIETISKTSIAGPGVIHGVIQNSEYFPVKCKAEFR